MADDDVAAAEIAAQIAALRPRVQGARGVMAYLHYPEVRRQRDILYTVDGEVYLVLTGALLLGAVWTRTTGGRRRTSAGRCGGWSGSSTSPATGGGPATGAAVEAAVAIGGDRTTGSGGAVQVAVAAARDGIDGAEVIGAPLDLSAVERIFWARKKAEKTRRLWENLHSEGTVSVENAPDFSAEEDSGDEDVKPTKAVSPGRNEKKKLSVPRRHSLVRGEGHREDANRDDDVVQGTALVHKLGVEEARVDKCEWHGAEPTDEGHKVVQLFLPEIRNSSSEAHEREAEAVLLPAPVALLAMSRKQVAFQNLHHWAGKHGQKRHEEQHGVRQDPRELVLDVTVHGIVNGQHESDTFEAVHGRSQHHGPTRRVEVLPRSSADRRVVDRLHRVRDDVDESEQDEQIREQVRERKVFDATHPRKRRVEQDLKRDKRQRRRRRGPLHPEDGQDDLADVLLHENQVRAAEADLREHERDVDSHAAQLAKGLFPHHAVRHRGAPRFAQQHVGAFRQPQHAEGGQSCGRAQRRQREEHASVLEPLGQEQDAAADERLEDREHRLPHGRAGLLLLGPALPRTTQQRRLRLLHNSAVSILVVSSSVAAHQSHATYVRVVVVCQSQTRHDEVAVRGLQEAWRGLDGLEERVLHVRRHVRAVARQVGDHVVAPEAPGPRDVRRLA
ncbi:hypothetical protein ON010_g2491 [Phytophthora cinnamomi]|nr:hypothetical protein ON010_g2491 [Phytophthora cinnamomi]